MSLLLISSTKSLANPSLDLNDPATEELIAEKFVDLRVCNLSLKTTTDAYNTCAAKHTAPAFWQTPTFLIGGFIISVSATAAVLCATHLMGACK
jgi:hypothetical protein